MDQIVLVRHKLSNFLHSLLLLAGMVGLVSVLGWIFAGPAAVKWILLISAVSLILSPRISPQIILRWYGARPLSREEVPSLYSAVEELARRAGLPRAPVLCYVPSSMLNAFTTGNRRRAAVTLTAGLLRTLEFRELIGVLAHEISHLKNNDLWIMNLSDVISRITSILSMAGQFLLIINLPLIMATGMRISWRRSW